MIRPFHNRDVFPLNHYYSYDIQKLLGNVIVLAILVGLL